jgi:hypothetical protein
MSSAEIHPERLTDPHVVEIKELCHKIAGVKLEDTQTLFGDLHEMATLYYDGALKQATQSFKAAQVAAVVGTAFFLIGAVFVTMQGGIGTRAWISLIAGATIQVISGLNFYMYGKATKQFGLFHVCLERMGRYLLANSVCANIENSGKRDEARVELARVMAQAPMLPIEGFDELTKRTRSRRMATPPAAKAATA